MYAVTGVTGRVGGEVARALLAAGEPVRAVVRDPRKASAWAALGCEVAIASLQDPEALKVAFSGATAAFILPPPVFDPEPGYPEIRAVMAAVTEALGTAKPRRALSLSTVGADAGTDNLLSQHTIAEAAMRQLPMPVTILRPAWFIDNAEWDAADARENGVIRSFLQPLDRGIPMVAARDVGRVAARLIQEDFTDLRVVELEGPSRVSPNDLAEAFSRALSRPVRAEAIPRQAWPELFRRQGMRNAAPRMRMLDAFNEGWIKFSAPESVLRGELTAAEVVKEFVGR